MAIVFDGNNSKIYYTSDQKDINLKYSDFTRGYELDPYHAPRRFYSICQVNKSLINGDYSLVVVTDHYNLSTIITITDSECNWDDGKTGIGSRYDVYQGLAITSNGTIRFFSSYRDYGGGGEMVWMQDDVQTFQLSLINKMTTMLVCNNIEIEIVR